LADILKHCDDIDAAFRRILYNPKLAIVFAHVFGLFNIPVGQAFGTCLAPSYFSLMSDIRAYILTCANLITGNRMQPLALAAKPPPAPLLMVLDPTIANVASFHYPERNKTFVDGNGVPAF
jgi:hypothetical protein